MGQHLAKYALVNHARDLTGNEFKVLMGMCLAALDTANDKGKPPGLCHVGQDTMLAWIGRDAAALRAEDESRALAGKPANAYKHAVNSLRKAVGSLVRQGLVEGLVERPGRGTGRQTYRLTFADVRDAKTASLAGATQDLGTPKQRPLLGRQNSVPNSGLRDAKTASLGTPKQRPLGSSKEEGEDQEKTARTNGLSLSPSTDRAREADAGSEEDTQAVGQAPFLERSTATPEYRDARAALRLVQEEAAKEKTG